MDTLKEIAERHVPGGSVVERPTGVLQQGARVVPRFGKAPANSIGLSPASGSSGPSGVVVVNDPVLGRRVLLIKNGEVVGEQG